MSEYILEMLDIVKEFPGVRALKGVQLKVRPGTVHTQIDADEMPDRYPSAYVGQDHFQGTGSPL